MDEVSTVRQLVRRQGVSIRAVAKQMGISRTAVRRYLRDDVVPAKRKAGVRRRPRQEALAKRLDEVLADAPKWTGGKQRLTGPRLRELLARDGFVIGMTTLYAMLNERKFRQREVFVPLVYAPGDLAEVDFFEVLVDLDGKRRKAWMFVMRLMHSGRDFAWIYERQDQISFLDGHVRAFAHFGGVPARIALDNLSAAVAKMLAGSERVLTVRYAALCAHFTFEPCFARPATGHDKGGVESRGRAIRCAHLVPIPAGVDLVAMSVTLLADLDARLGRHRSGTTTTIEELFAAERPQLLPLPTHAFEPAHLALAIVGRNALVRVRGAYYSVWSEWAGRTVEVLTRPSRLEIVGPTGSVHHPRLRFGGRSIDYCHYLRELSRKPQALRQVSELLMRDLGEPFASLWRSLVHESGAKQAARAFAKVLACIVDFGMAETKARLLRARELGEPVMLALRPPPPATPTFRAPASLQMIEVTAACAADFDVLLGVAQ